MSELLPLMCHQVCVLYCGCVLPHDSTCVCVFSVIGVQPNTVGGIQRDMWGSHDSLLTVDGRSSQEGAPVLLEALLDGQCLETQSN